jgi:hypothetical protein
MHKPGANVRATAVNCTGAYPCDERGPTPARSVACFALVKWAQEDVGEFCQRELAIHRPRRPIGRAAPQATITSMICRRRKPLPLRGHDHGPVHGAG